MSKLNALIEQFADRVIAAIHNATVEEILGESRPRPERSNLTRKGPKTNGRSALPAPRLANEITDPEALLAASEPAAPSNAPVNGAEPGPRRTPARAAKPPTVARPTIAPPPRAALREGESVARATGAGVVIKRRPKS